LLAFAVLAASLTSVAADAQTATIRWAGEGSAGDAQLVVQFEHAPSAVETRVTGRGFEVLLPDCKLTDAPLPARVEAAREGTATRLRIAGPGAQIQGVRLAGNAATIDVHVPAAATATAEYAVGVGDVLNVSVYGNPDLSGEFPVSPDGTIAVPLVGPLPVAGLSEAAITQEFVKRLGKDYLVDPQVSVSVKTYQSQFIYVTGAVPHSSRVAIRSGLTLRGALADAGAALSPRSSVVLTRATGEVLTLDAAALDGRNAPLPKDGDVISVQESNFISIYGEVRRANRLALTPDMTLLQAIAMAEGLTDWANKKKVQILRKSGDGTEKLVVNLGAVERHEIPDPVLQPEDVIIVGRRVL
ncbi:MAG TPA: polysaccharide biosynthesis/export family protein, partial [Candidatus Polarisedimenticolaceae bacterium]|nr:polysaccharide biosynthesis/export family protein [Candidatus Polarisedimenticolaceae bacterium]